MNRSIPRKLRRTFRRDSAFTLLELMISIAMVLALMIGVAKLFETASSAVGAGQTLNEIMRNTRSTQLTMFDDFNHIVQNPPCFIISSERVTQFQDTTDAKTSTDPNQIVTDNGGGIIYVANAYPNRPSPLPLSQVQSPAIYNYRSHRTDIVRFFARGAYSRRSANDGSFSSSTQGTDAFITLGHALQPTYDQSVFIGPSTDGPSPLLITDTGALVPSNGYLTQKVGIINNPSAWYPSANAAGPTALQRVGSFASDWVLARNAIILKDSSTNLTVTGGVSTFTEDNYAAIPNVVHNAAPTNSQYIYPVDLMPLGYYSPDDLPNNNTSPWVWTGTEVQTSRYDLANITLDQFRRKIADAVNLSSYYQSLYKTTPPSNGTLYPFWWNPLVNSLPAFYQTSVTGPYQSNTFPLGGGPGYLYGVPSSSQSQPDLCRFAVNPLLPQQLTAAAMAQASPNLVPHCTQFIVEYAADCLQQDNTPMYQPNGTPSVTTAGAGAITGIGQDGQIDYYLDVNGVKHIRWYGMPRSGNGATPHAAYNLENDATTHTDSTLLATIRGYDAGSVATKRDIPTKYVNLTVNGQTVPFNIANEFTDVIPLRDYYNLWYHNAAGVNTAPPWEVEMNFDSPAPVAAVPTTGGDYANPGQPQVGSTYRPFDANARYTAAWANDMPAMVRILIKVDDPTHKVQDGPWQEYVFKLK